MLYQTLWVYRLTGL